MKHLKTTLLLFAAAATMMLSTGCTNYDDDIKDLNTKYDGLDKRVTSLEEQARKMNSDLEKLSVLATAVENGFYVTDVKTVSDGFELTLNNGRKIFLQNGANNTLAMSSAPNVSMIQLNGTYYWTLEGMLIPGSDGKPMPATGQAPMVRFNSYTSKWEISINGGASYTEVNLMPISISETILKQVINEFLEENSNDVFNDKILYQIISDYIQSHTEIFDPTVLNTVIQNFVNSKDFDVTIINNFVNNYIENHFSEFVNVDMLIDVIVNYLNNVENKTTINNILYQVFNNFFSVNASTFITPQIITEVINSYDIDYTTIINNHLTNQELITIIEKKLNITIDNNFNINSYKTEIVNIVIENFLQIITKNVVLNIIHAHFTEIFKYEDFYIYINQYFQTLEIDVKVENNTIITNNVFIQKIFTLINTYFIYYHETIFNQYFNVNYNFKVYEKDYYVYIEYGGKTYQLGKSAELQSIVFLPNTVPNSDNGYNINSLFYYYTYTYSNYDYHYDSYTYKITNSPTFELTYLVTPASMAKVIADNFAKGSMNVSFCFSALLDGVSYFADFSVDRVDYDPNGSIRVTYNSQQDNTFISSLGTYTFTGLSLHVKDSSTDYRTTFIPIVLYGRTQQN